MKKFPVEGVLPSRFEVNVEQLEGSASVINRIISTQLDMTSSAGVQWNVAPFVVITEGGGVNDDRAPSFH